MASMAHPCIVCLYLLDFLKTVSPSLTFVQSHSANLTCQSLKFYLLNLGQPGVALMNLDDFYLYFNDHVNFKTN